MYSNICTIPGLRVHGTLTDVERTSTRRPLPHHHDVTLLYYLSRVAPQISKSVGHVL